MSDNLFERLTDLSIGTGSQTPLAAIDRIKELEAKLAKVEVLMDIGFAEYKRRLAKAVELALEECPFHWGTLGHNDWWHDRRTTLAELKGDKP